MSANDSSGKYLVFHMSFWPADFILGIKAMTRKSKNKFLIKFSEDIMLDGEEWKEVVKHII